MTNVIILVIYLISLVVLFFFDLKYKTVPLAVSVPVFFIAFIYDVFQPNRWTLLVGGLVGFLFMGLLYVLSGRQFGSGDVTVAVIVGLMVGFPAIIYTLAIAWILGGLVAGILLKLKKPVKFIPMASMMAVATAISLFWLSAS